MVEIFIVPREYHLPSANVAHCDIEKPNRKQHVVEFYTCRVNLIQIVLLITIVLFIIVDNNI